jgi:RNA polymerase sigma factor (sigma-70 family)
MINQSSSYTDADKELIEIYRRHMKTVYRLCYMYLQNIADAEGAVQSIFLKLAHNQKTFNDHGHEKAWLITTAKNHCKNILKSWWRIRRVALNDVSDMPVWEEDELSREVRSKLFALPERYKTVLYLYYFEGYTTKEIADILKRNESTIRTQLQRGRERLKIDLGGGFMGDKHINEIFESLTPTTEQEDKMIYNIITKNKKQKDE